MRSEPAKLGRVFRRLLLAGGAANLGDGMTRVLLPLLALSIGVSPSGVAAVTAASTLAWPVFGLHAGWLVDRVNRRRLLVASNVVRGFVLASVAGLYARDGLTLPMILGAALILGLAETIVDTSVTACVPTIVPPAGYGLANARLEATINVTNELVGPSLAGLLAGLTLTATAGSGAVLYIIAGTLLVGLALVERPGASASSAPGTAAPIAGLTSGLSFIWKQPLMRPLVLFTAAMNVVWGGALALLVVYAVAPGPLGLSPTAYGVLLTTMAAGGLAASVLTEPLRRLIGDARLLIADCVGTVLLVLPVALGADAPVVAAGAVVAGAGSSVWRIINATIRQVVTPENLLGRVYAATRVISWGVVPVSATLAGLAADVWGVRAVFAGLTALASVIVIGFLPFAANAGRVASSTHDPSAAVEPPESGLVGEGA